MNFDLDNLFNVILGGGGVAFVIGIATVLKNWREGKTEREDKIISRLNDENKIYRTDVREKEEQNETITREMWRWQKQAATYRRQIYAHVCGKEELIPDDDPILWEGGRGGGPRGRPTSGHDSE